MDKQSLITVRFIYDSMIIIPVKFTDKAQMGLAFTSILSAQRAAFTHAEFLCADGACSVRVNYIAAAEWNHNAAPYSVKHA